MSAARCQAPHNVSAGATLMMALSGALVAWILRKIARTGLLPSYALGIAAMTFVAAALYVSGHDGTVDYLSAWVKYAIGGVIAFLILYTTSRRSIGKA
ncbi:hypothetical protein EOA22_11470 [Mesorhizobium sp. M7A.F.Ca.US.014.04.1.1]|uniref:hypothetical protein n=2 Tax=Mesorhizobium TaxID=68287 RepID=UPI0007A942E7|nr:MULTISPECIES: hypothetical protein [Mesorhizobium]RVB63404.1 hypothetical protein EN895_17825 [Mesorhizobium sp. M7A.F.Ca.CA.002.03.2.1]AMX91969.1 hypothetical protein A4R28_01935 [Mesorhizobium ciceri]MBZ9888520.1 hypothetical protein [Mesorhizobium sp. BR1-1-3]MDF3210568.1 hypothetical protein [Mesorhizobium sp. LMG15046]MDF3231596.1 hypothetical protein [Mesorhizobium sp. DSM 30133]